jgi:hypothetical protein
MKKFFRWLFELPGDPEPAPVVHQVTVQPAVLNPTIADHINFAEWRAAHIQRYLDDPQHADAPHRDHLEAEKAMHLAALRINKGPN